MEYVTDEEGKSNLVMDWSKPNTWTFSDTYLLDFEIEWREAVLQALGSIDVTGESNKPHFVEGASSIYFNYFTTGIASLQLSFEASSYTNKSLIRLHETLLEFKVLVKASKKAQYFP